MIHKEKRRGIIAGKRARASVLQPYREAICQGSLVGSIFAFASLLGQWVIREGFFFFRVLAMWFYGFTTGSLCYLVYRRMEEIGGEIGGREMGYKEETITRKRIKIAAYKVAIDQLVIAPISNAVYTIYTSVVERKTGGVMNILSMYIKILLSSYRVWPIVQMFNFLFVPLHYRMCFLSLVSVAWNTYLVIISARFK